MNRWKDFRCKLTLPKEHSHSCEMYSLYIYLHSIRSFMFQYDHPMWCCFNFNSSLRQTQFAQCIRRLQRSARRSLSPRGRVGMRNNISALLMEVLSIMFSKVEAGWKRKARTFLTEVCNHVWVVIGTNFSRSQTCQSPLQIFWILVLPVILQKDLWRRCVSAHMLCSPKAFWQENAIPLKGSIC